MEKASAEQRAPRAWWAPGAILLAGWTLFVYGSFHGRPTWSTAALAVKYSPLVVAVLAYAAWRVRDRWWPACEEQLRRHTRAIDAMPVRWLGLAVAGVAGLALYSELMVIRLHASYFQLFAYFKNVSLLSCFLGLGVGYTLGRRTLLTPLVLPGIALQILLMELLGAAGLGSALQNPVSEELAFGVLAGTGGRLLAAYGFLGFIFVLNALCFLPLGQLAARLMSRMSKLTAYGWNLAGSLGGIIVFNLLAYLWTPPAIWLALTVAGAMVLVWTRPRLLLATGLTGLAALGSLQLGALEAEVDVYSPYQKLTLRVRRGAPPELRVNHVYYQRLMGAGGPEGEADPLLRSWRDHYDLPYRFQPRPGRVLVVGAGTGNDVAAGVRAGAGSIEAVEIDPAILEFGKRLHPDAPYQAPNVRSVVDDARAFLRNAGGEYDLIVYGLLDSHTLLSGKAGVRLDSYVYTVEAFREARARLAEGGLISLTFSLIRPALGRKLYLMLQEAFDGQRPLVMRTGYDQGTTFLIGEGIEERAFPPITGVEDVTAAYAAGGGSGSADVDLSTDDWPFFYMPERTYPTSYLTMILALLGISLLFIRQTVPRSDAGFSAPCFFLGVGFMLVETKAITELALVYGSTWFVTGIVIAGILVMAFLANLVVLRRGSPRAPVTYGLLLASIAAGSLIDSARLGGLPAGLEGLVMTIAMTLPLFFSGFAFSSELARARSVGVALSSNLLGAMLGGFLEYNAMFTGFGALYWIAFGVYGLAFLTSIRRLLALRPLVAPRPTST